MANRSVRKMLPPVNSRSIADTLSVFGEKSKVADSIIGSLKDSFLNILSAGVGNIISGKEFTEDIQNVPINIGADIGGGYGLGLGLNVPSQRGGKEDYRVTFSKKFEEGGKVDLDDAIKEVNQLFSSQEGGAKLSDQTDFMRRIAATESNFGKDKLGDYSFSAFQLDPIRYEDIKERGGGGTAKERVDVANEFLSEKLGREDFDIMNLNLKEEAHNPYIGATLARLGLASIPESVPKDLKGQAKYWKDYWNTEAGKGTEEHFISQSKTHNLLEGLISNQ